MNAKAVDALILALALLIVLPVLGTVNATLNHHASGYSTFVADGSPGPPPGPHAIAESTLVAAGSPGPPPVPTPWFQSQPELVAAGSPGPPPVPHAFIA